MFPTKKHKHFFIVPFGTTIRSLSENRHFGVYAYLFKIEKFFKISTAMCDIGVGVYALLSRVFTSEDKNLTIT